MVRISKTAGLLPAISDSISNSGAAAPVSLTSLSLFAESMRLKIDPNFKPNSFLPPTAKPVKYKPPQTLSKVANVRFPLVQSYSADQKNLFKLHKTNAQLAGLFYTSNSELYPTASAVANNYYIDLLSSGIRPTFHTFHHLIRLFARFNDSENMMKYFKFLISPEFKNELDSALPISVTRVYDSIMQCLHLKHDVDNANLVFSHHLGHSVKPGKFAIGKMLTIYVDLNDLVNSKRIYDLFISRYETPNLYICNCMIKIYSRYNMFEKAQEMFDLIHPEDPDKRSFNFFIAAYSRKGDVKNALLYFERMIDFGLRPDAFTFETLIQCLLMVDDLDNAKLMYERMISDVKPSSYYVSVLLCQASQDKMNWADAAFYYEKGIEVGAVDTKLRTKLEELNKLTSLTLKGVMN